MRRGLRIHSLVATAVLAVLAAPDDAAAARAPDLVNLTCEYRDGAATAFARLLQLSPDREATLRLEVSDAVHAEIRWTPATRRLRFDGPARDRSTQAPPVSGPRWQVSSPYSDERDIDDLAGWRNLYEALRPLEARRGEGVTIDRRVLEADLGQGRRATLTLARLDLFDFSSRPMVRSSIALVFGAPVGARDADCRRARLTLRSSASPRPRAGRPAARASGGRARSG